MQGKIQITKVKTDKNVIYTKVHVMCVYVI